MENTTITKRDELINRIKEEENKLTKLNRNMAINEFNLRRLNIFKKSANISIVCSPLLFIIYVLTLPLHSVVTTIGLTILGCINFSILAGSIINLLKMGVYDKKSYNDFYKRYGKALRDLDMEIMNTKTSIRNNKKLVNDYDSNNNKNVNDLYYVLSQNVINDDKLYLNNEYVKTK